MIDWQLLFYRFFNYFVHTIIVYVAVINTIYFFLTVLGFFALRRYHARLTAEQREALIRSPLLPEIAVIAPAYNESLSVRESVKAMLKLSYPRFQVIVVNDGSTDDTLKIMIEEFRLYRSARTPMGPLSHKPIRAIYESRDPIRLLVIDKVNGGKADSLNAGQPAFFRTPPPRRQVNPAVAGDGQAELDRPSKVQNLTWQGGGR